MITPNPVVTNANVVLCKNGSWAEMNATGCNAFAPSIIKNPGWDTAIFSKELPEIGLNAALFRKPEK